MNTCINYTLDPFAISFRMLRNMVENTDGKPTPTVMELCHCKSRDIIFAQEFGSFAVAVFKSGFYLCRSHEQVTVCTVNMCQKIRFQNPLGEMRVLNYHEFMDGPCLIPLILTGCERMGCLEAVQGEISDFADSAEQEYQRLLEEVI